jgi:flagellar biosynthesis chaperone FliJ
MNNHAEIRRAQSRENIKIIKARLEEEETQLYHAKMEYSDTDEELQELKQRREHALSVLEDEPHVELAAEFLVYLDKQILRMEGRAELLREKMEKADEEVSDSTQELQEFTTLLDYWTFADTTEGAKPDEPST